MTAGGESIPTNDSKIKKCKHSVTWEEQYKWKGMDAFSVWLDKRWVRRKRGGISMVQEKETVKNFEYSAKKFGLHNGGKIHVRL